MIAFYRRSVAARTLAASGPFRALAGKVPRGSFGIPAFLLSFSPVAKRYFSAAPARSVP